MQNACASLYFLTSQTKIIDKKRTRNILAVPVVVIGRQECHVRIRLRKDAEFRDALQKSSQHKTLCTCKTLLCET